MIKEHSDSLTSIQRSLIVWAILNRTRYEDKSPEKVGIQRLVTKNVYKSAYPLHDGDYGGKYLVFESSRSVKIREFSFLSLHAF